MKPYLQDADFTLYQGDALEVLRGLPDESVDCCVTSPPYWGLRDYGIDGQLGLEPSPLDYVEAMAAVFREVRRVLAPHGTLWLNLGDSFNSTSQGSQGKNTSRLSSPTRQERLSAAVKPYKPTSRTSYGAIKPKDLMGMPWRVAFALQDAGWYLRMDNVWNKPNPMPESVTDRPTKAHEYVFLLAKSPRYFFDQEAVREGYEGDPEYRYGRVGAYQNLAMNGDGDGTTPTSIRGPDGRTKTTVKGQDGSLQHRDGERWPNSGRNVRSVWTIATQPYSEAHFATFPEELVRRCIVAGTSERGVCPECGAPWEREVESKPLVAERARNVGGRTDGLTTSKGGAKEWATKEPAVTIDWRPSCDHDREPVPSVVLDPFGGSGTTALVARKHGRRSILIELNADYCALAARRLQQQSLLTEATA